MCGIKKEGGELSVSASDIVITKKAENGKLISQAQIITLQEEEKGTKTP